MLDCFHDDDRIIDDDPNRKHQSEERQIVYAESSHRHRSERSDDGHRDCDQWN